jgi:hypothetical protein
MSESAVEQAPGEQSSHVEDTALPEKPVEFIESFPPALRAVFGNPRVQRAEDPVAFKALDGIG